MIRNKLSKAFEQCGTNRKCLPF